MKSDFGGSGQEKNFHLFEKAKNKKIPTGRTAVPKIAGANVVRPPKIRGCEYTDEPANNRQTGRQYAIAGGSPITLL